MYTSASLSAGLTRTSARGWAVNLLVRFQQSSIVLTSFTFGLFLPFITKDLGLSLLQAGLLQGVWWITSALLSLPFSTWFSRFRPTPLVLTSLLLMLPFLFLQGAATNFLILLRIGIINGHSGTEAKYPIEAPPSLGRSSRTSAGQASL